MRFVTCYYVPRRVPAGLRSMAGLTARCEASDVPETLRRLRLDAKRRGRVTSLVVQDADGRNLERFGPALQPA